METFLAQVINGLSLGSIYALIALGYTMVYGIIQLINFAHGDVLMIGAFAGYFAIAFLNMPFWFAMLFAMLISGMSGYLIERLAYRPLRKSARLTVLITAIGVSLLLENGGLVLLGADYKAFPLAIAKKSYLLFDGVITITNHQLIIFGVTIAMMVLLQYIVNYTKIGRAMRAVSYDKEAAALMGINVNGIISITFVIGSMLAAVAGVLL